jgi:hypothetical protein
MRGWRLPIPNAGTGGVLRESTGACEGARDGGGEESSQGRQLGRLEGVGSRGGSRQLEGFGRLEGFGSGGPRRRQPGALNRRGEEPLWRFGVEGNGRTGAKPRQLI